VGPQGPIGGALNYADFYALMPPDNATNVAPGEDVAFPRDGANTPAITRVNDTTFSVSEVGTYLVMFQVPVTQTGQLVLTLNGEVLDYTLTGRNGASSQIVGMALVNTTVATSVFTLRNPDDGGGSLTITPTAGGEQPVSAHLVILQIA
jgi:hypothetical protein